MNRSVASRAHLVQKAAAAKDRTISEQIPTTEKPIDLNRLAGKKRKQLTAIRKAISWE